jgi:DsbC/DsbD-like thiol-disulfide interchange protein/cytochrome c biogenesis protein CcdA
MLRCYRLLVAVLLQALLPFCTAQALAAPTHIAAELLAEGPVAPGETVMLALHMRPEAGWHGYWSNPGDAGFGMALKWRLPAGSAAGAPQYPVPQTLLISGLMNHVYERDYAVLVPLKVARDARSGSTIPIAVEADWLACTDQVCVPEKAELQASLTIAAPGSRAQPSPLFDQWRMRLPAPMGAPVRFAINGNRIRIAIPLPDSVALHDPHLFVREDKLVDYSGVQTFSRLQDLLVVELPRAKLGALAPAALSGVLRLELEESDGRGGDGLAFNAKPGEVPSVPVSGSTAPQGGPVALAWLLLGALAGGLLLNIMPCVFPILSLKALSLARAGESEAEARREGLAYTAGVIVACLGLGALLLALRAGGSEIGWAFQLQEPLVVAALLLLAVTLTANFLGLFEFAVPGFVSAGSTKGAFATGLLAAFVATPCTGPFMAAAMGAALLLPVAQALVLFAALGLGIALPFLAIAFVPALRRMLPKPGRWMITFRRWMALPMGLTALALLWLASRVGGLFFAAVWLGVGIALVALLMLIGTKQRAGLATGKLVFVEIAALLIGAAAATPHILSQPEAAAHGLLRAEPFSEQALAKARATGKPVFLFFTADWCLTCKVNEQVAIEREETRDAFVKAGVIVLVGDWTRRDPAITRFLTAQGAAGVPLYLWYPAGGSAPQQLPQVLTPGGLAELAGR